ncbi:MAG: hypothetical protein NWQ46_11495 [Spirosomaceae bacterium]|nr:hypothetical protein [Spirosomataceae bacterium]
MQKFIFSILFATLIFSCESQTVDEEMSTEAMIQAEATGSFNCINEQADKPITLTEANSKMAGEWQLKAIMTMIPSNEVPNIVLKIDKDLAVSVYIAGKKQHDDQLSIATEAGNVFKGIVLQSSRNQFSNGDFNFLYGNLRVCDKEMLIDNGMAFDAPAYFFRKK